MVDPKDFIEMIFVAGGGLLAFLGWFFRLEAKVKSNDKRLEKVEEKQDDVDEKISEGFKEINIKLAHIEGYLTRPTKPLDGN